MSIPVFTTVRNHIRRIPQRLLIILFGVFVVAAAWWSVFYLTTRERDAEVARIHDENMGLARAFEEHVRRVITTADNALLFLKEEYEKYGRVTEGMVDFVSQANRDAILNQIAVADERGDLILSAVPQKKPINVAGNETFRVQKERPDVGMYIAKPIVTQVSGTWSFFLCRRLEGPDGSFVGIVTAGLDPAYFSNYYSVPELGESRSIMLVGTDGTVRARRFQQNLEVGQDISGSRLFEVIRQGTSGNFEMVSLIDGLPRFASFRLMPDYPLIVVVADLKETALATFEERKRRYILSVGLFSVLAVVFGLLLLRAEGRSRSQNERLAEELADRRKAEKALHKSYISLQAVIDSMDSVIYVADMKNHEVLLANKFAREKFGNVLGKACWSVFQKGQTEQCSFCVNSRLVDDDGNPLDTVVSEVLNTLDGRWYECRDKAIRWVDDRLVRIEIASDITERKRLEQEMLKAQKLESVGIFAGGIAHDFNNLLQAITGFIALSKTVYDPRSPEKMFEHLAQAEEASEAAKELSYRLLTFSKGGEPVPEVATVEYILKRAVSLSLSGSNVTYDLDLSPGLHPVEVDIGQMTQVFSNILINAKEAMPEGGKIWITGRNIRLSGQQPAPLQDGEYVQISLRDRGAGIPADVLPKIFDPYFTTKGMGPRKGSGLGLSICLSILKRHGGNITAESRAGEGATFHVVIPVTTGAPREERMEKALPEAVSRKRVLVMDDDEKICSLAGSMLDHLGHGSACAKNGEEAVALFRKSADEGRPFDLVILDMTVQGGMGGEAALELLRETAPDVRAVISSGYADDVILREFRKFGFADALAKPYSIAQLKELLGRLDFPV